MRLPKRLKIGALEWNVRWVHDLEEDGRRAWGGCDNTDFEIRLDDSLRTRPAQCMNVLLHELLHAVAETYDVRLSESQVLRLANGLAAALKDNHLLEGIEP